MAHMFVLFRIDKAIGRAEMVFCVFCLVVISISTALGVIFRYLLSSPLAWSSDTGILALVWLTFVGAAALYRDGGHVAVTGIVVKFPPRVRIGITVVSAMVIGTAVAVMGWFSVITAMVQAGQPIVTLDISRSWYSIPIVWSAFSMGLATMIGVLRESVGHQGGKR